MTISLQACLDSWSLYSLSDVTELESFALRVNASRYTALWKCVCNIPLGRRDQVYLQVVKVHAGGRLLTYLPINLSHWLVCL